MTEALNRRVTREQILVFSLPCYFLTGMILREVHIHNSQQPGLESWIQSVVSGWLLPYYFGALFSDWWLLRTATVIAVICLCWTTFHAPSRNPTRANHCVTWIFWLSMISIWIESLLSIQSHIFEFLIHLILKSSAGIFMNTCVTFLWIIALYSWTRLVNREWQHNAR